MNTNSCRVCLIVFVFKWLLQPLCWRKCSCNPLTPENGVLHPWPPLMHSLPDAFLLVLRNDSKSQGERNCLRAESTWGQTLLDVAGHSSAFFWYLITHQRFCKPVCHFVSLRLTLLTCRPHPYPQSTAMTWHGFCVSSSKCLIGYARLCCQHPSCLLRHTCPLWGMCSWSRSKAWFCFRYQGCVLIQL